MNTEKLVFKKNSDEFHAFIRGCSSLGIKNQTREQGENVTVTITTVAPLQLYYLGRWVQAEESKTL